MGRARISRQRGFTYIAILLAVALHGAVLAAVGVVWSTAQKREREKQLLFVGNEFRNAIRSYSAGGGAAGGLPESLEALLRDPRTPALRRHLRKIYVDPMTGKAEWGLIRAPEGKGILGVYSLSEAAPLKVGNFSEADKEFENKATYAEWKFAARPAQPPKPGQPGAPGTPVAPGTPGAQPTAPGTLPGALQTPPAGTAAQPAGPGAAPAPLQQPPAEPQAIPVLQPTQPQQPPTPPPAEPAVQPAEEVPPPQEAPAPDTDPSQVTAPAPQPEAPAPQAPPAEAPAPQAPPAPAATESPFTPGVLTPMTPMAPPPADTPSQ